MKTNLNDDDAMLQIRSTLQELNIAIGTRAVMQSFLSRASGRKILIYLMFNCILFFNGI